MDTAQWPQVIGVVRPVQNSSRPVEKKPRPQREQDLNCPRCNSTNTKFCYYNNYSLSQPRYFCKTCRRYWTEGGTLRNVPVGGGSRKKQRSSTSSSSSINSSSSSKKLLSDGQDLNLGYNPPIYNGINSDLVALPYALDAQTLNPQNPNFTSTNSPHLPFMELLKTAGNISSGLISAPVSNSSSVFSSSAFPMHEFKPSLSFALEGFEPGGYGSLQSAVQDHTSSSRIGFPFDELKPFSNGTEFDRQDRGQQGDSNEGFWNGMLPGGSW